jgi:hypothetical protein
MSIFQKVEKVGGRLVLVLPDEEIKRLNIEEGHILEIRVPINEESAAMPDEIREAFERSWKRSEKAYRYLSGR